MGIVAGLNQSLMINLHQARNKSAACPRDGIHGGTWKFAAETLRIRVSLSWDPSQAKRADERPRLLVLR